ncbi:Flp family type IVb pilin [Mesorhizobium sp. AaZ16]|uniref:Flp family type IVb pilin n=1 Tax=Mesorhizobium sp. AaZ16 TaxID=3402289 RepID=UPI00374FBED2
MRPLIRRFLNDDSAATAIEYGLIATLIAVAIFGGVGGFSDVLGVLWNDNSNKLVNVFSQ